MWRRGPGGDHSASKRTGGPAVGMQARARARGALPTPPAMPDFALAAPFGAKRVWIEIGGFEHPSWYKEVPLLCPSPWGVSGRHCISPYTGRVGAGAAARRPLGDRARAVNTKLLRASPQHHRAIRQCEPANANHVHCAPLRGRQKEHATARRFAPTNRAHTRTTRTHAQNRAHARGCRRALTTLLAVASIGGHGRRLTGMRRAPLACHIPDMRRTAFGFCSRLSRWRRI
jgi:hypothetical protein